MDRKVFCLIPPRRKAIKLGPPSSNTHDIDILRVAFSHACETDSILKALTANSMIVFQLRDETGAWCDMEPEDRIENLSEINVVLISKSNTTSETSSSTKSIDQLLPGEVIPLDVNVIYSETPQTTEVDLLPDYDQSNHTQVNDGEATLSMAKKIKLESPTSTKILKQSAKLTILPELTITLKSKLINGKIPSDSKDFFKFWGEFLFQETNGAPHRNDYGTLATSIVTTFPELAGGSMGSGIVRSQLSTWIRNHRASLKSKTPSLICAEAENMPEKNCLSKAKSLTKKSALMAVKSSLTAGDIESALKELEKPFKAGKNIVHYERLLEDTKDSRRAWIEKQLGKITDIIEKYPCLGNNHMIIHECVKVIFNRKVDDVLIIIETVIDELYEYYAAEAITKCSKALSEIISKRTDKVESLIIEQVYKDLLSKPLKNKPINPLWTTCEVLISTQNWSSAELSAPRALIYFSSEDVLTQAFILADKDIKIEVPAPTISSVLLTLLSTYYTWHLTFPTAYYSVLDFFIYKVFDVNFKKPNGGAAKFERLLNASKKRQNH